MSVTIQPNCRYGHGDLMAVQFNQVPKFSMTSPSGARFSGILYVCTVCGYTEFFDDNPMLTIKQIQDDKEGAVVRIEEDDERA